MWKHEKKMACLTNGAFVAIVVKTTYSVCVGIKLSPATIVPSLCSLFVVFFYGKVLLNIKHNKIISRFVLVISGIIKVWLSAEADITNLPRLLLFVKILELKLC